MTVTTSHDHDESPQRTVHNLDEWASAGHHRYSPRAPIDPGAAELTVSIAAREHDRARDALVAALDAPTAASESDGH